MSFGYQILGFGSGESGVFGMTATGGTISTTGDYKVHKYTADSTFVVSALGGDATYGNKVEYLIVAGGGGGGIGHGSAGGGGGYRTNGAYDHTVTATTYPITVGAAGPGGASPGSGQGGNQSVFPCSWSILV